MIQYTCNITGVKWGISGLYSQATSGAEYMVGEKSDAEYMDLGLNLRKQVQTGGDKTWKMVLRQRTGLIKDTEGGNSIYFFSTYGLEAGTGD